jgi:hypothetical protein
MPLTFYGELSAEQKAIRVFHGVQSALASLRETSQSLSRAGLENQTLSYASIVVHGKDLLNISFGLVVKPGAVLEKRHEALLDALWRELETESVDVTRRVVPGLRSAKFRNYGGCGVFLGSGEMESGRARSLHFFIPLDHPSLPEPLAKAFRDVGKNHVTPDNQSMFNGVEKVEQILCGNHADSGVMREIRRLLRLPS